MDVGGADTVRDVLRVERLSYIGSNVSSHDDEDNFTESTQFRKIEKDENGGTQLRSGDAPNLYHWRHIGLLVQYAAVGLLYGGLPRTVYPFLNNYLRMNGYQTLSARVLLSLPWSFKVLIGIVSDCFPIFHSRRRAYMVLGWIICSSMLLILVFVDQEPPYYLDSSLRGKDLSKISPAELQGRVNVHAPSSGSFYIVFMMLASVGYMIADVASDGLVVEFAQQEPENIRGNIQSTVYLVRSVLMILAALLVGFGLNGKDYGGSFTWSLTISQLMLIFSLLSLVAIPAALWFVQEPVFGDRVPQFSKYMHSLWMSIQNSAMVQILAYRFFSGIFDGFTVTAGDPIQRYWASVHPLNESLFSVLGLVVFSAALYVTKRIGLGWSWHRVISWTTVSVIVLDAIVGMLTIWGVVRSQWFWLGTPILEELPQAMNFLVSTFVVVELADLGNEAAVYGLMTTVSNLSSPFASCISKNVNALFDVGVADIIRDSQHVRLQVTWTFVIAYIMKLLSLLWLPLLPRQKRETQALKQRSRQCFWGGIAIIVIFVFALVWSITTNLLSVFPKTACRIIAGGPGCNK
ncbi:putative MFS transporter superfamily, biopterin transporter family [Plasmopara halstedii]